MAGSCIRFGSVQRQLASVMGMWLLEDPGSAGQSTRGGIEKVPRRSLPHARVIGPARVLGVQSFRGQNKYFRPNCISRLLSTVDEMRPKPAAPRVALGPANCGV